MIRKNNLYLFFRINKRNIICICLLTVLLTLVGLTLTLLSIIKPVNTESIAIGEKRYTMIDNLLDSESFSKFRNDEQSVNNLGNFYNMLTEMNQAKLLSMYRQPIYIHGFKGDKQFYYNTDEFLEYNKDINPSIKALQINNAAFEYYDLRIKKGTIPSWEEISYHNKTFPVVLGSNYEGLYEIGELFTGEFLIKNMNFEVVGILEDTSLVCYRTESKLDLSDYVLMPYPIQTREVNPKDFRFEGMLYFNMINSDLVSNSSKKDFLAEVRNIANSTGFHDFSIIGIDQMLINNQELVFKVAEYKLHLLGGLFAGFILVTLIIFKQLKSQILKSDDLTNKKLLWFNGKLYILSFFISLILQFLCIPRIYKHVIIINFFMLLCIYLITNAFYLPNCLHQCNIRIIDIKQK